MMKSQDMWSLIVLLDNRSSGRYGFRVIDETDQRLGRPGRRRGRSSQRQDVSRDVLLVKSEVGRSPEDTVERMKRDFVVGSVFDGWRQD